LGGHRYCERKYKLDGGLDSTAKDKSATLAISISAEREKELVSAADAVYKDLLGEIDRWGIDKLIAAGRKAYG